MINLTACAGRFERIILPASGFCSPTLIKIQSAEGQGKNNERS